MKAFHFACMKGHSKIAQMLILKSSDYNIELNAKNDVGIAAFHMACFDGHSKTAETLVQKSADFSIGLNCRYTWPNSFSFCLHMGRDKYS